MQTNTFLLGLAAAAVGTLTLAGVASAQITESAPANPGVQFDQDVTPDILYGTGVDNGSFATFRDATLGLELGLRGSLRFDENNQPQSTYNSNGAGSYTFQAGTPPTGFDFAPNSPTTPVWNFDFSVNTSYMDLSGVQLNAYTYELRLDGDPSSGVNFLSFDPINVANSDNAIGNNATGNGQGDDDGPRTNAEYAALIASNNVGQNSGNYEFFNNPGTPLANFDPNVSGVYTIQLEAFNNGASIGLTSINVVVVPEPASLGLLSVAGLGLLRRRRAGNGVN